MIQPPSFTVLRPGEVFHSRYRVVSCIKAGGMGAVYEVLDETTDSPRALKVMLPDTVEDPDQRARFALEAKVTGNIVSDHLIRVSDAGIDEATGAPFLVMDLLRGEELGAMLARRGILPAEEVVTYLGQAALALDKTHAAAIVHRDLKPGNLYVTYRDDGSPCVKLLDFGIAKIARGGSQSTRTLGTPLFMSPEQIKGDASIGPRADLYALAHVAYALLAGEPYWTEESKADESLYLMLTKILEGGTEAASARASRRRGMSLPAAFDAWFARSTAVQPDARFDRATTAITALADALGVTHALQPSRSGGAPPSFTGAPAPSFPAAAPAPPSAAAPNRTQPVTDAPVPRSATTGAQAVASAAAVVTPAQPAAGAIPVAMAPATAVSPGHAPKKAGLPMALIAGALVVVLLGLVGGALAIAGVFSSGPSASGGPVVYGDTFDNDKGRWFQPLGAGNQVYIEGGRLNVVSNATDSFTTWPTTLAPTSLRDFTIEVDVTRLRGQDASYCGVAWRVADTSDGYAGGFNGAGLSGMTRYESRTQKWKPLAEFKKSAAIKPGNTTNRLKIVVRGGEMTLFVNDQPVVRGVDNAVPRGRIGFYVTPGMKVAFDNFRVTR